VTGATGEVATYGSLHAGDIVLGFEDGLPWGVEYVSHRYGPSGRTFEVGLVRHGVRVAGWPETHAPVSVVQRSHTALEAGAYQALADAGLAPEVIEERWTDVQQ
jgi:hypothetical protein